MPNAKFSLEILSRFLICVALLLSLIWGQTFWLHQSLYHNRNKYTEEVFEVTGAEYSYDASDGTVDYSLSGTIAGREEQFEPRISRRQQPRNKSELLAIYPKGTKIPVLYNPEETGLVSLNGENLRVLLRGPNFWNEEASLRRRMAVRTFVPVPLAFIVFFFVRYATRRKQNSDLMRATA